MKKYKLLFVLTLCLFTMCLFACDQKITSISLSSSEETVEVGSSITITATINPSDATNKELEWSTSDSAIATANNGVVTGVSVGEVKVYAKSTKEDKQGEITINVVAAKVAVSSVVISNKVNNMSVGQSVQLTSAVEPSNATNSSVTWEVSNNAVVTVSQTGLLTAVGAGEAKVTATADGKSDSFDVEVVLIPVTGFTISNQNENVVEPGKSITFIPAITPANASNIQISWETSNEGVATVNNGVVTGLANGTAIITAKLVNYPEFSVSINVNVTTCSLSVSELKVELPKLLADYTSAKAATVKIEMSSAAGSLTTDYAVEFNSENMISKLACVMSGINDVSCYINNSVAYMYANGNKGKYTIDSSELQEFTDDYKLSKILETSTAFYSEDAFYSALVFEAEANNVLTYNLALGDYEGEVLNPIGKDSITLKVTLENNVITCVELVITEGTTQNIIKTSYIGQTCNITFPSDLEEYPAV